MSKKSKSNKDKKKKPGQGQRTLFFQDLTAERHFQTQMAKALKLGKDKHYAEALETLEPLEDKFSDRADLFELLGVIQYSVQAYDSAREAFARAMELEPLEKRTGHGLANGPLIQFNLASSYVMSGFPLLAFECMQKIDCASLDQIPGNRLDPKTCREFSQVCDNNVTVMAEKEGLPREQFLAYGLALEKAYLALPRNQAELARSYFLEASQLRPEQTKPFLGLSVTYTIEGDHTQARQPLEYILEKLDSNNLDALNSLVRLIVTQGTQEEARQYEPRLAGLPLPENIEDRLKLAGVWAYLDEDRRIFDLIEPVLNSPELRGELITQEEDEESLELFGEALLLGVVAAAHLGQTEQALRWLKQEADEDLVGEENSAFALLERTWQALENHEVGPRPGDRFFYYDPRTLLKTFLLGQQTLVEIIRAGKEDQEAENQYRQLVEGHRNQFMQVLLYDVWIQDDVPSLTLSLELIAELESEEAGETGQGESATLRRLAFSRAGNPLLHLSALAILIRRGNVDENEPQTIWLGDRPETGTLTELSGRAIKWSEESQPGSETLT
jgi:tetratricopeptide (TPR) repeat protein